MAILLEIYFFLVYLTVGPLAWGIFIYGMNKGRKRLRLLTRPIEPLPDEPPHVTMLIPAKDEAGRIHKCLLSALGQDYPRFDVIAINDRSSDHTGAIMDALAAEHERLQVIHIRGDSPPAGWTGKCNALYRAVSVARGQWLLFVDSDVVLQPDVLRATIGVAMKRQYNLLSLMPALEARTFWERLLVPLAGCAVSSMYLVPLGRPFANGQYLCIKRDAYDAIGGHAAVYDKFCEDVEIARRLKSIGGRPRMSWGADFVSVRMYSSLGAILRGWGRNFFAASLGRPWRILAAMGFVIACCLSAYAAAAFGAYRVVHDAPISGSIWLACGLLHLAMMTAAIGVMYRWTRNSAAHAVMLPLASFMLMAVFLRALWMCYTGRVEWRGTRYTHRMSPSATQATS